MNNVSYARVLELGATIGSGLSAGGMAYITLVEAPSRSQLSAADQLQHWRSTFPRAMRVFKAANIAMVPVLIGCSRLSAKRLYLAAALPFALLVAFTSVAMMRTNKKLLTCASPVDQKEEHEVKALVGSWARKHAVRVCLALCGFVCTACACALPQ